MTRGFYPTSHNVKDVSPESLKRALQDENVNRDLFATDVQPLRYIFAPQTEVHDFEFHDFIQDGDWHMLDLGQPLANANPKIVQFWAAIGYSGAANRVIRFYPCLHNVLREPGVCCFRIRNPAAGVVGDGNFTFPIDKYKKIAYNLTTSTVNNVYLKVIGWWE